jgi:hypothetical protein
MKKGIVFFLCFLFTICICQAQSSNDLEFQLHCLMDKEVYDFKMSSFYDMQQLLHKKIKKDFLSNRKKGGETYYATSLYTQQNQKYYYILEYLDMAEETKYFGHTYSETGKWMYSHETLYKIPKNIENAMTMLEKEYIKPDTTQEKYNLYHIKHSSGKQYYMMDIPYHRLSETEKPDEKELALYEGCVLRVVMNNTGKILKKMMMFGSGTELYELQMCIPMFFDKF